MLLVPAVLGAEPAAAIPVDGQHRVGLRRRASALGVSQLGLEVDVEEMLTALRSVEPAVGALTSAQVVLATRAGVNRLPLPRATTDDEPLRVASTLGITCLDQRLEHDLEQAGFSIARLFVEHFCAEANNFGLCVARCPVLGDELVEFCSRKLRHGISFPNSSTATTNCRVPGLSM